MLHLPYVVIAQAICHGGRSWTTLRPTPIGRVVDSGGVANTVVVNRSVFCGAFPCQHVVQFSTHTPGRRRSGPAPVRAGTSRRRTIAAFWAPADSVHLFSDRRVGGLPSPVGMTLPFVPADRE